METSERIDAQEPQQTGKPPGVIDIGETQSQEPAIGFFSIFLHIGFRAFALLNDRADRRSHGEHNEQKHRQLDRSKKIHDLA